MKMEEGKAVVCSVRQEEVKELHNLQHVGVDRMLYLERKVNPDVTREVVQRVVRSCGRCQSLFTNPSARTKCDTGSIFKQSLTGLNSEFSFSLIGCLTKAEEPSLPCYLPIAEERIVGFFATRANYSLPCYIKKKANTG